MVELCTKNVLFRDCICRVANFLTAFSSIGGLHALCNALIMALTATASGETQSFIVSLLSMSEPLVVSQSLNRPNIFFSASGIKSLDVSIQSR